MHFKHTATTQANIQPRTISVHALLAAWSEQSTGSTRFQDPVFLGMLLGTGKAYILGETLSSLHNKDIEAISEDFAIIFEMLTLWTELITHVQKNPAPQNVIDASKEVRKHIETLAPGLIREDKNPRLWTLKCRLFSEIVPVVSDKKMPFKDICIFFEKALTQTTRGIQSMMELPASLVVKDLVSRMKHTPLPNDVFCQIAYFLETRQRYAKSEPAIFHGFLDHTKWAHPNTFTFHPKLTKSLTTLGYMIDDPTHGYDFAKTFCFGILPRLSPESRAAFRAGNIISEDNYDFTMDLMSDEFTAAFIQLLPPNYHDMAFLLGKVLAHFDELNPQFQNKLDADIANVIIETPQTTLRKARTKNPERYPLILFCIDGTRHAPESIPDHLSEKLAISLTQAFLSDHQDIPSQLGYIFKKTPYASEIQHMVTSHLEKVSPYIPSRLFEKEFRKITYIDDATSTLRQMLTCCNEKTSNAHSEAITKHRIIPEACFRLLLSDTQLPTPLRTQGVIHSGNSAEKLSAMINVFIAAKTTQAVPLSTHIPQLCTAWLMLKEPRPSNITTLLQKYPPIAPHKDTAIVALLTGVPIPIEITSALVKECYTILSDNDAVLVGQAMLIATTQPETSRLFSEAMWKRIGIAATEVSWLADIALHAVIAMTKTTPDIWPHLLDIAKQSTSRIQIDAFKTIHARIMATFSPETHPENFRELFRNVPRQHRALITQLAIESPTPIRYLRLINTLYGYQNDTIHVVIEKAPDKVKEKIIEDYCHHWIQTHPGTEPCYVFPTLIPLLITNEGHFRFQTGNQNLDLIPFSIWRLIDSVLENTRHPLFSKACTLAVLRPEKISSKIHKSLPWLNPDTTTS